ncbi:BMQ_0737 family morphogenetic spore coat protein [Priestia abyssalis]|uniref:hypothetical protein n=1 Tax=Priestia abyssalis TaxID=1221450 RepID=UPI0009955758|nr:hypothetical protein [Priestia abyssalis]
MLSENVLPAHCVRVPKIFDWINRSTLIKLKEIIQLDQETETDRISCNFHDIKRTNCYLSDRNGHPSRCTASCKELTSPDDRTNIQIMIPDGKLVTLQRIDLLKQGFVTVQFFNRKGQLCLQSVFPFSGVETVLLCAPPGTDIHCEITEVDCKAHLLPPIVEQSPSIDVGINILLCQSIVSTADVKVELTGTACKPREESTMNDTSPLPPEACPVFPEERE